VQWRAGKDGQPDGRWMREFWEYATEERLPAFRDWPLLPTCEGTLCSLGNSESKVVDGASALSDRVKGVLSRLGVRMLDSEYITRRERLSGLVHRPNLRGVLRALGVANNGSFEHVCQRIAVLPGADKRELRALLLQRKWLTRDECSEEAAVMILSLPLHEVHAPGDADAFVEVDTQKLPPPGAISALLTNSYLKANEEETEAYRFLGVGTARLASFYADAVFPRLGQLELGVCEEAVLKMLAQLPQLCHEDPRFWDRLSNLAFVKTGAGKLARPWELYDPNITELQDLLQGGEFYPAPSFLKPELIATLVRLGLQTSLDRPGILKVARAIAAALDSAASDPAALAKRGRSLLSFLARQARALGLDERAGADDPLLQESDAAFRRELRMLSWVPVRQEAPSADIPWPAIRRPLASPDNVRLEGDAMLASHAMAICSEQVTSEALCEFLGWREPVPPVVLAQQLIQYASIHGKELAVNPLEQPMSEAPIPPAVRETVTAIYGLLGEQLEQLTAEQADAVAGQLRRHPCLLIGEAFVSCDHVALTCECDAAPLLHALPEELTPYLELFVRVGVRERFHGRDYLGALQRLAKCNRGQTLEPEQVKPYSPNPKP